MFAPRSSPLPCYPHVLYMQPLGMSLDRVCSRLSAETYLFIRRRSCYAMVAGRRVGSGSSRGSRIARTRDATAPTDSYSWRAASPVWYRSVCKCRSGTPCFNNITSPGAQEPVYVCFRTGVDPCNCNSRSSIQPLRAAEQSVRNADAGVPDEQPCSAASAEGASAAGACRTLLAGQAARGVRLGRRHGVYRGPAPH